MAEDHRRVETRQIVGTGMATDPERLQSISDEQARRERAWRDAPERAFNDILQTSSARGSLVDEVEPDRRRVAAAKKAAAEAEPAAALDNSESPPQKKAMSSKPLPRIPDPRERLMRAQLAALERAQSEAAAAGPPSSGSGHGKK